MLSLLSESRPEENEVKSEAQFQRLLASYTGNPLTPKTPRAPSDRGRYPEEAEDEQEVAIQSDDDDDELCEGSVFEYNATTEAINISRKGTPARSISGDDLYSWGPGSPVGSSYMDVDPVSTFLPPKHIRAHTLTPLHIGRFSPLVRPTSLRVLDPTRGDTLLHRLRVPSARISANVRTAFFSVSRLLTFF